MNDQPLIEFNPKLPQLSTNEKAVLKLLIEAGRLIAPIYLLQEKQIRKKFTFSPKEARKINPDILSPYTVVENIKGKIVVTPYHLKYATLLKPVADKLMEASKTTENKEYGKFLKIQANALIEGTYEAATAAWMKMKPYILDISIGPVEHHDEQVFFGKAAYQSWVGVVDPEETKKLLNYKNIILNARRESLIPGERLDNYKNVKAKVDHVILFSGLMARTNFVGINLPMNLSLVEKYGSEVTIFNETNDFRLKEQILPTFNKLFSAGFRQGFSPEDFRRASLSYVELHELAHNYLYYKNAAERLEEFLPTIYELTATLLGMKIAGSMLLKDIITNKELESMIITFVCRSFDLIQKNKKNKFMNNYAVGGAIFINFMGESGALKSHKGLAIPNFMKIFVSLNELSYILERLLSSGTKKDAEVFIKKYGQLNIQ